MGNASGTTLTLEQVTQWLGVAEGRLNLSAFCRPDHEQQKELYRLAISALSSNPVPIPCPYCTNENEAIRDTFFDQTCRGCVSRMK